MPRSGWVALGAIIGAIAAHQATRGIATALALLGAAVVVASWGTAQVLTLGTGRVGAVRATGRGLGLVAIGIVLVSARSLVEPPAATSMAAPLPSGDGPWTARIESVGAPKAGQRPGVVVLDVPVGMRIAGSLPGFPVVVPGDRVTLSGALRAPPTDDPYGDYLVRIGVRATIRVSRMTVEPPTNDIARALEGLRRGADVAIGRAVPEPEAGLASGILIGLRDRVDRDLSAAFTAVGATHVVAISGWNIAIVATTLAALAGRLARRRRVLLTAFAIVAYVVFVGPSPSVVRAAGMAGVVMIARELGRPSRAAAAIGWAVVALLTVDPRLVDDVGFQLSALATVGLIAWGTPFAARLAGTAPGRPRAWLAESLGVSLAAQLATLPIVVLAFGRLSLVSPLVNLGVVPLVAPAMGAGVVALGGGLIVMAGLPSIIATFLGLPAWLLFSVMVSVVRAGASLPFASVQLAEPWNGVAAVLAGFGILMATLPTRRSVRSAIGVQTTHGDRARPGQRSTGVPRGSPAGGRVLGRANSWWRTRAGRLVAGGLATSVIALAVVIVHRPDGIPRIVVLDVGQGDAILVEGGSGSRLLVDGGPDPGRLLVALDEHLPPWDRRIDVVILSHPHEDHAAGLAALLDRYVVGQVFEPGMFGPGPGYAALNAELVRLGIRRGTLSTGDRVVVDEFHFRVLWPDSGTVPERPSDGGTAINNVSIVLFGEVGGHRVLLAGDIEEQIDPQLVARGLPTVDFLKVAHHGSRTSSTEAFLEAVRPAVAAISAGRGNPYGHPAPATVARLKASGAQVLRTDTNGTVSIDLGPGPLRVRSSGARAAALTTPGGESSSPLTAGPRTTSPGANVQAGARADLGAFLCAVPVAAAEAEASTTLAAPRRTDAGVPDPGVPTDGDLPLRYDAARDPPQPNRSMATPAVMGTLPLRRRVMRGRGCPFRGR